MGWVVGVVRGGTKGKGRKGKWVARIERENSQEAYI